LPVRGTAAGIIVNHQDKPISLPAKFLAYRSDFAIGDTCCCVRLWAIVLDMLGCIDDSVDE
jgi:hypothetical protein